MRFGIRSLLFVIFLVSVACALFVVARNTYYADRRQTELALAQVSGISEIKLHSHVDVVEEVNSSSFSVDGFPGSIVELEGLGLYANKGRFWISRIGKWKFKVSGRRRVGVYRADTGEPIESDYFGSSIELGHNSPYKDLMPFEINTMQDLADRYGDLVELFETWPRKANPGSVTLEDGTIQSYFVVEDDE